MPFHLPPSPPAPAHYALSMPSTPRLATIPLPLMTPRTAPAMSPPATPDHVAPWSAPALLYSNAAQAELAMSQSSSGAPQSVLGLSTDGAATRAVQSAHPSAAPRTLLASAARLADKSFCLHRALVYQDPASDASPSHRCLWDVRSTPSPRHIILAGERISALDLARAASRPPMFAIFLECALLPPSTRITVRGSRADGAITVRDIFEAILLVLQADGTDPATAPGAAQAAPAASSVPRLLDWLGPNTRFRGLTASRTAHMTFAVHFGRSAFRRP